MHHGFRLVFILSCKRYNNINSVSLFELYYNNMIMNIPVDMLGVLKCVNCIINANICGQTEVVLCLC